MITEQDLLEAIAECQGVRNPNASTCVKLAAYYTILDHLQWKEPSVDVPLGGYSFRGVSDEADRVIEYDSGTEFSEAINGQDPHQVWPILDELMDAVRVLHPRLYAATLRKLND